MIADIVIVFMNSERKNSANRIDEYSVWKPPTRSCSASTRSNGGRLSSAVDAIRNTMKGTNPVILRFQLNPDCVSTITLVDREPEISRIVATDRPSAASYDTICVVARTDPSSGYFDPDDQPASIPPYTA